MNWSDNLVLGWIVLHIKKEISCLHQCKVLLFSFLLEYFVTAYILCSFGSIGWIDSYKLRAN